MFNDDGSYSPPDAATRHVLISTKAHSGYLRAQGMTTPVAAGTVHRVEMLGQTNVVATAAQYRNPAADAVWIEHATAKEGDVLSEAEFAPLVEVARKRQDAVRAFHAKIAAERENPPA